MLDEPTIRSTLADMATALESSRMLLWRAAIALDSDATDKAELCAMAKRYVNCWAVHTNCPVPGPVPTSPADNDFTPGFATALMNKDLGLAMDAVSSTGSAAPLGSHAAEIYAKFAAANAALDFSAVIEMLRG